MKKIISGFARVRVSHQPCDGTPDSIEDRLDIPADKHNSHAG